MQTAEVVVTSVLDGRTPDLKATQKCVRRLLDAAQIGGAPAEREHDRFFDVIQTGTVALLNRMLLDGLEERATAQPDSPEPYP
ncbi:hypothetical protein GCM10009780_28390 [Actinomadura alba]